MKLYILFIPFFEKSAYALFNRPRSTSYELDPFFLSFT